MCKNVGMSTSQILGLLIEDRDRIQAAIDALLGGASAPVIEPPDWVTGQKAAPETAAPEKRKVSAAARRKMAEGQKRRWAVINAAKAEASAPKKAPSKKAPSKTKAVLAAITPPAEETEFKAKMSAAMKKDSAKRKKTAAKKKAA
jgi:hypothetical protein